MESKKINNLMHKVLFVCNEYPEKTMKEIFGLFQVPALAFNVAVWAAKNNGFLKVNEETSEFKLVRAISEIWASMSDDVKDVIDNLSYMFEHLSKIEEDIEENNFNMWMAGYHTHDQIIAVKTLMNMEIITTYTLKSDDSDYVFYTLKANLGKEWGKKQFKDLNKVESE